MAVLRQGRHLSQAGGLQTLYLQEGPEPSDEDPCVGMVASRDLAVIIVRAVNDDEIFRRRWYHPDYAGWYRPPSGADPGLAFPPEPPASLASPPEDFLRPGRELHHG